MKYKRTSTNPSYQAILLIPVFGIDGIRKEVEGETLSKSKWRRISMYGVEQFVPGGTAAQCWFEFKYTSTGRKKSWPNEASKIRRRYALNKRHRSWYTFSQQQYHHIVESIFISMRVLQPAHNTPIRLGHSEFRKEQSEKLGVQIQFWLEYLQCLPSLKCSRWPSNQSWRITEISSQWAPLWKKLKKPVSKKKKNSEAHYQQISVTLQLWFDGHLEHFKEGKHCSPSRDYRLCLYRLCFIDILLIFPCNKMKTLCFQMRIQMHVSRVGISMRILGH